MYENKKINSWKEKLSFFIYTNTTKKKDLFVYLELIE